MPNFIYLCISLRSLEPSDIPQANAFGPCRFRRYECVRRGKTIIADKRLPLKRFLQIIFSFPRPRFDFPYSIFAPVRRGAVWNRVRSYSGKCVEIKNHRYLLSNIETKKSGKSPYTSYFLTLPDHSRRLIPSKRKRPKNRLTSFRFRSISCLGFQKHIGGGG